MKEFMNKIMKHVENLKKSKPKCQEVCYRTKNKNE